MEVAIIDWANLNSRFVRDEVYEHINAPQWFDFSVQDAAIDDESWFCRPDCNHPKTVEDFYRQTPPNSKKSSGGLSKRVPFTEITGKRDSTESENQNPNSSTPLNYKSKVYKEAVKSSAEKKEEESKLLRKEESRSLKSTLSARNLFGGGGGDILSKVTEFCSELKKLTLSRKKEKEDTSNDDNKANSQVNNNMHIPEKPTRKARYVDENNTPTKVNVKIIKKKKSEEENMLLPIRTCPPTPQCISATRGPPSKASPLKEIIIPITTTVGEGNDHHQDKGYKKASWKKEEEGGRQVSCHNTVTEKEAKDVFWFLKPCTISSFN